MYIYIYDEKRKISHRNVLHWNNTDIGIQEIELHNDSMRCTAAAADVSTPCARALNSTIYNWISGNGNI